MHRDKMYIIYNWPWGYSFFFLVPVIFKHYWNVNHVSYRVEYTKIITCEY